MATRHYFWRHGQSRFNAGETREHDTALTELGLRQAMSSAAHLRYLIDKDYTIFVSPYLRTIQTAQCLSNFKLSCKFLIDPRICENVGEFRDRDCTVTNRNEMFKWCEWPHKDQFDFNKVSNEEYIEGLREFISELPKKAIIVSHMTTIEHMIKILCGRESLGGKYIGNGSVSLVVDGKAEYVGQMGVR